MTTSWAHLAHGQPTGALAASVSGTVLAVLALATTVWLASTAALGQWLVWRPNAATALWILGSLAGITLLEWVLRISFG